MKVCVKCEATHEATDFTCPECGYSPDEIDGFRCFAPDFAQDEDGFDPDFFIHLRNASDRHFLLKYRNRLILRAISDRFGNFESLLEIGCGTGAVLKAISATYPSRRVHGSEINVTGLRFARDFVGAHPMLFQMDATAIPFRDEFDVVGMFDVIEHINDDDMVLEKVRTAIKPGGGLILTAPQHPWLWSKGDEAVHHKRRYKVGELAEKARRAGFEVVQHTSYNTFVLPALAVTRVLGARTEYNAAREWSLNPVVNGILHIVSCLEGLVNRYVRLPIGGSVIVVARRPD